MSSGSQVSQGIDRLTHFDFTKEQGLALGTAGLVLLDSKIDIIGKIPFVNKYPWGVALTGFVILFFGGAIPILNRIPATYRYLLGTFLFLTGLGSFIRNM